MGVFLEQMETGRKRVQKPEREAGALVGSRDIPLFYARVLEGMEALGILQSPEIRLGEIPPQRRLKARFEFDSDSPDELRLRPTLSYGDFTFSPAGGRACSAGESAGMYGGILYQPPDHAVLLLLGG